MTHTLRGLIWEAGLDHRLDALEAVVRRSVRMLTITAPEQDLPLGSSKLGGAPDLPPHVAWPTRRGRPLSFIGQINLADLAAFPSADGLPARGLLSFFYDAYEQPWGFDPEDAGSWRVMYLLQAPSDLQRRHPPRTLTEYTGLFTPCRLHFYEAVTLPPADSLTLVGLGLDDEEWDRYHDLLFERMEMHPHETMHQILGHPDTIQGDMQVECQLVSHGFNASLRFQDNPHTWHDLAVGAEDWQLLLQLDSDDRAQMMWGDCGRLYFWIRRTDLLGRAFEKSWLMLQCY